MLRRRIFSSAMASVMALSSVAVVANAEETAVANYKTKADLEAYVASFDGFRESDIYDYGSMSGEDFLNAIEYAENVIADAESTNDDFTVAYDMLEATYNALKIYSAEELKVLIDSCTAIYERGNIYNEELNDEIYTTDSFANFEVAYDDAASVLDSNDSRVITDAYEVLKAAKDALNPKFVVTKAQFRAALKEYETMLSKQYKYESWRRGAFTGDWVTLPGHGNYWYYQGGIHTYGIVYDILASWQDDIYAQYDVMDRIKTLSKTSDETIVEQYKYCIDAPVLLNNWIADDTDRATKNSVAKLLDEYHGLLVHDYAYADAMTLYKAVVKAVGKENLFVEQIRDSGYTTRMDLTAADVQKSGADEWVVFQTQYTVPGYHDAEKPYKDASASLNVKCNATMFSIPIDEDGYYKPTETIDVIAGTASKEQIAEAKAEGLTYKKINKKSVVDLTDYIEVMDIADAKDCGKYAIRVTATSANDVIADVKQDVAAADAVAAEAAETISTVLASDEGVSMELPGIDWAITVGNRDFVQAATIDALPAADKKVAEAHYDGLYKALEKVLAMLKKLGISVSATTEDVAANGAAIMETVEEIQAAIAELDPYMNKNIWANYQSKLSADAKDDTAWNLSLYIDYVVDILDDAKAEYNEAADTAYDFVNASKLADAAARTEVHNADINGVIDGGYTTEQNGWNLTVDSKKANVEDGQFYVVDLETAYDAAMFYLGAPTKDQLKDMSNLVYYFSTNDDIVDGTGNGSSAEWTLVYRYLKYALEDKYGTTAGVHTKAEIVALIEEAYKLADDTGDASLFAYHHDILVDTREAAVNWVKEANKDKKYKDNTITYAYNFRDEAEAMYVATDVYNKLKTAYDELLNDYNNFKYSFQQIHDDIALAEDMIDAGELEGTETLLALIEEASLRLSIVEPLLIVDGDGNVIEEFNDNDAFTSDRFFQGFNRLYTHDGDGYELILVDGTKVKFAKAKDNGANFSQWQLKEAYEALLAEIKAQTEVTVLKGDVNGDGVVNAFDASTLLKNIVNSVAMDAAVADYDGSGVVNALDASAILKAIVNA